MRNHNLKLERRSPATTPEGRTMLGAGGIVGIVALLALKIFGFNALLPILAAMLVAAGFAIAAIAWVSGARRHDSEVTSWDIAGVLAFLGFAAAMIAV